MYGLHAALKYPMSLLAFLLAFQLSAQDCNGTITGHILDLSTEEPLPFATLLIVGSQNGTISESDGSFVLTNICDEEVNIEIRFLGYKTIIHHHDFRNRGNANNYHTIYLSSDDNLLESIVVEGDEMVGDLQSLSLERISQADIATKTTQSLAAAIGDIQGVSFASTGTNVQLPVIHGLYGNRILVINNGVKHGFQNWGTEHAPEIDITGASNISVLKGAAGVRYGPEALGGVVVVEGNPLDLSKPTYGGISTGYQTNGRGYHATGQFGAGYDKFSFHIGGNYTRIGDRSAPDYLLWNTGMIERSANVGFRFHLPEWDIKAYYSYIDQDLGLLRPSVAHSLALFSRMLNAEEPILMRDFSYKINEPNQNIAHHLATLEVEWISTIGKFALLLSQQINNRREFDVRRNAELPIIDLTLLTTDNRLEWYHPEFGELEGIVGLQLFSQNNDNNPGTDALAFIPNYNNYRFSVFAIESLQKGGNLLELGLRLDHEYNSARGREQDQSIFSNEFSFTNITASFGLVRDLSNTWQLRSNIGTAWRTPNMAELYSFGQNGFRIEYGFWRYEDDTNGNVSTLNVLNGEDRKLEAEKSYKWTNELSFRRDADRLTLTGYLNFIDNFLFDRPAGVGQFFWGPGPTYIFDQSDALFVGTDITYSRSFTEQLKGTFGTSFLYSRNVERNEPLINQPPININAELAWETPSFIGLDYSKVTLQSAYTFEQFFAPRTIEPELLDGDPANGEREISLASKIFDFKAPPAGYFLTHTRWEWRHGSLGGQLEVRNVFNTSYRDYLNQMRLFADDLGRNFLVTIKYNF